MAFVRKGSDKNQDIKILTDKNTKLMASDNRIICPHCHKIIGAKTGDVFAILDKRFVKIAGQKCPECGKTL